MIFFGQVLVIFHNRIVLDCLLICFLVWLRMGFKQLLQFLLALLYLSLLASL